MWSIGVPNKSTIFNVRGPYHIKPDFVTFSLVVRPSWRWSLAKTSRCRDLAIFVIATTNDGTDYFTPLRACARGNKF